VTLLFITGDTGDVGIATTRPTRAMITSKSHEGNIFAVFMKIKHM
jgi:hypothetical protein